jgi:hypothetical protein
MTIGSAARAGLCEKAQLRQTVSNTTATKIFRFMDFLLSLEFLRK